MKSQHAEYIRGTVVPGCARSRADDTGLELCQALASADAPEPDDGLKTAVLSPAAEPLG